jgi:glyoxylase-like metal-dependent hydrolase (beta-lactamase superfamily II)
MDAITVKTFVLGELSNNCYLVFDKETKEGFIVDAPYGLEKVYAFIRKERIKINFIILTHAHFDHIAGLSSINVPFYIHPGDLALLKDSSLNGSYFFGTAIAVDKEPIVLEENSSLCLGSYQIEIIPTPGHTPGSISILLRNLLFSGDTIFLDSIGRTDVPLASHDLLLKSIKENILTLSEETIIYPGHGPSTSVGQEKRQNPFLI